jgi:Flp pilus assembly pilin Flp
LARLRQARRNEEGAALVEFAIVSVLLFTLLFGIVEFGLAFRDRLTMANASQSAARVLAALGNEDDSDFQALSSLATTLETLPNSGVDVVKYVDIYKADIDGNPVGSCPANEGPGDRCTRFLYDPVNYAPCNWEPCPDPAIDPLYDGAGWPFAARDVGVPDLDIAVVRVTFGHEWVTGSIVPLPDASCTSPPANCWEDIAILRLEPKVFAP